MKKKWFIKTFLKTLFGVWLLLCGAENSLAAARGANIEVVEYYNNFWDRPISYKITPKVYEESGPIGLESLPDHCLPITPEGTVWYRNPNRSLSLMGNKFFDHIPEVEFYTFSGFRDGKEAFAYLSLWDNVTVQGYSTCSPTYFGDLPGCEGLREQYPPSLSDLGRWEGKWRGHIIDFSVTIGNGEDPSLSTRLVQNYHPEPPESYWSRTLGKMRVDHLRSIEGAYSRFLFYNQEEPRRLPCGLFVPFGVVWSEFGRTPGRALSQSYSIPFSILHRIHRAISGRREFNRMQDKGPGLRPVMIDKLPSRPRSYLAERASFDGYGLPEDETRISERLGLSLRARSEAAESNGKVLQIIELLRYNREDLSRRIRPYVRFAANHVVFLDSLHESRQSVVSPRHIQQLKELLAIKGFDADDSFIDVLEQAKKNYEDNAIREKIELLDEERLLIRRLVYDSPKPDEKPAAAAGAGGETPPRKSRSIRTPAAPVKEIQRKSYSIPLRISEEKGCKDRVVQSLIEEFEKHRNETDVTYDITIIDIKTRQVNDLKEIIKEKLQENKTMHINFSWVPKPKKPGAINATATPKNICSKLDQLRNKFSGRFTHRQIVRTIALEQTRST